jgi:hypothetical protein
MTTLSVSTGVPARYYRAVPGPMHAMTLDLVEARLQDVCVTDGRLVGPRVAVDSHAVMVGEDGRGGLHGIPTPPLTLRHGGLHFDPSAGGVRTRENRRARGAFNAVVAEANAFGMVNAYVHADAGLHLFNQLLRECGADELPPLRVVVGAHFGSRLSGYRSNDGDRRTGSLRPMSGGHYRLSMLTSGVPELDPVSPAGEIHLGPCRYRKPFAGRLSYLRNAAHNPAIIDHELGHHLCRHTADFRVNAQRAPDEQRNGKTGIEEGICDYFAAVLLGTARPYGWYRADGGRRRDMHLLRHVDDPVETVDAHSEGAVLAAALWRCREELVARELLADPTDHDRLLVAALLEIGQTGLSDQRDSLGRAQRVRMRPRTMIRAYRSQLRAEVGRDARRAADSILVQSGLREDPRDREAARC